MFTVCKVTNAFVEPVVVVIVQFKLFACDGASMLRDTLAVARSRCARCSCTRPHAGTDSQTNTRTQRHPASARLTNTFKLSSGAMHSDNNNNNNWRRSFAAGGHLACEPSCISLENRINVYQVHTDTRTQVCICISMLTHMLCICA